MPREPQNHQHGISDMIFSTGISNGFIERIWQPKNVEGTHRLVMIFLSWGGTLGFPFDTGSRCQKYCNYPWLILRQHASKFKIQTSILESS